MPATKWLFNFQLGVLRWHTRAFGYLLVPTNTFPPLELDHRIRCDLAAPAAVARHKVLVWKLITPSPTSSSWPPSPPCSSR
jgi:hypothetical protein